MKSVAASLLALGLSSSASADEGLSARLLEAAGRRDAVNVLLAPRVRLECGASAFAVATPLSERGWNRNHFEWTAPPCAIAWMFDAHTLRRSALRCDRRRRRCRAWLSSDEYIEYDFSAAGRITRVAYVGEVD